MQVSLRLHAGVFTFGFLVSPMDLNNIDMNSKKNMTKMDLINFLIPLSFFVAYILVDVLKALIKYMNR